MLKFTRDTSRMGLPRYTVSDGREVIGFVRATDHNRHATQWAAFAPDGTLVSEGVKREAVADDLRQYAEAARRYVS